MPYQDLVDIDNRTHLETLPSRQVEFNIHEVEEDGEGVERLHAKIGDSEVLIKKNPRQFELVCHAFGVPFKFAENVSQTLLGDIFTELADRKGGDEVNNWLVDTELDELVSYGDVRKPYIPYGRVGDILLDNGLEVDGSLIRHGGAEITGTHPSEYTVEPRQGDIVRSGVNIRFNPTMDDAPLITPWSLRLVCTNGMTSLREKPRIKVVGHSVDDILDNMAYEAQKALEFGERMNHGFADMVGNQVNPVDHMENLITSGNIPSRMHESLMQQASALAPDHRTAYDVLNIYTRMASGIYDPDARFKLQAIGGDLALDNHLHCGRCGHELA